MRKIVFLDSQFLMRREGEIAAAAAIAGIAGLVTGIVTSESSSSNVNKQLSAQQAENEKNRAFETEQAEIARQYNTSEREASQQYQIDLMNMQNEYNDPTNQVARYRSAGFNPILAMGSSGLQSVSANPSASSPASSPFPGSVGGLSPVSFQPLDLQLPVMAEAVSNMLQGTAQAKKAGMETSYLEKSMNLNLKNLSADTDLKTITAKGIQLDNMLKDQKMPAEVRRAYSDAKKACYDALVSMATVGKVENETDLLASQKHLNDVLSHLRGHEDQLVKLDIANYFEKLNSVLNLQRSESKAAVASAEASYAGADASRASAEASRATARKSMSEAEFQEMTNRFRKLGTQQEFENYIRKLSAEGYITAAEAHEAGRRLHMLQKSRTLPMQRIADDVLEYFKDKVSIFK